MRGKWLQDRKSYAVWFYELLAFQLVVIHCLGIASLKYGAKGNVKIHLTGAFNNAAQSFDDFYCGRHHDLGVGDRHY